MPNAIRAFGVDLASCKRVVKESYIEIFQFDYTYYIIGVTLNTNKFLFG